MKPVQPLKSSKAFVDRIRELEGKLFPNQLFLDNASFMKNDGRHFWHFRPSHHFATGILTEDDVDVLSRPGKRLLSIGAYPGFLERTLLELGVPAENIVLTDKDPAIEHASGSMEAVVFDAHGHWPDIGTFDYIIFPESLCISMSDHMRDSGVLPDTAHIKGGVIERDIAEAALLTTLMRQSLERLRPGGVIRANGPMSHPNVIRIMSLILKAEGYALEIESRRFFLSIRIAA